MFWAAFDYKPACATTTRNSDYKKMKGWQSVVQDSEHRKELVAGNLAKYAVSGEPNMQLYRVILKSPYSLPV